MNLCLIDVIDLNERRRGEVREPNKKALESRTIKLEETDRLGYRCQSWCRRWR